MPTLNLKIISYIGTFAVFAVLVAALFITRATLAECKQSRAIAETHLTVSNGSIERLEQEIARMSLEQADLAKKDASRIAASREALELARAAERWREAAIDRLTTSAAAIETADIGEKCEASPAVASVWN